MPACAAQHGPGSDRGVIGDAHLAAQHGEIADRHAAGNPDLGDDQAMPADRAVVSDLDQVVDLGALADDRVAGGAAVDRGIGADFDVVLDDDAAGLRDFLMALRRRQIAKAVLADAGASMDDDAIADQGMRDRRRWRRSRNPARCGHPGRRRHRRQSGCRRRSRRAGR